LVQRQSQAVDETAADNMNTGAVGREDVEPVARGSDFADADLEAAASAGKSDDQARLVESVVGKGQPRRGQFVDSEAGFLLQELQLVQNAADGVWIGGPARGLRQVPAVLPPLEPDRFGEGDS